MATNYTITGNGTNADGEFTFGFVETIGDSVGAGNMITSAPLTITPNDYYVVQASDFSIGDALPSDVTSVVFTDTGTPNEPGNTVLATVNFASGFTVTASKVVTVDIDGTATFIGEADDFVSVDIEDQVIVEFEALALGLAAGSGITISQTDISSNLKLVEFSGQATPNKSKSLGTITLTADSGYYFTSVPYFKYYNKPKSQLQLVIKTVTKDSNNRRTAYSFDLIFKSAVSTSTNSGSRVKLITNTAAIPQDVKQITKVSFGPSQVSPSGEERVITVHGTKDAEFNLTITDNTDKKSILDADANYSNSTLTTVLNPVYGSIDAINKKFSGGFKTGRRCSFRQKFPQYSSTILTTAINMGGGLSGTTATFDALTNVRVGDRLKMDTISTGDTVTVTALNSSTEAVLSQSVTADDDAVAVFTREQKYFINLFPLNSTTLGLNIPSEEPHYTIHQYMDPVLKLTVSETDGGYTGPTTVYTKNGRANAFPADISDRQIYAEGTSANYFKISYSITSDGGKRIAAVGATGGVPTWSSTDASASMWTNSVSSANGGTHIEISNIKMTGLPTSTPGTCTLTADVNIIKWGTEDVTMNLDLDQIITTA